LARAENEPQYRVIAAVFEDLQRKQRALEAEIAAARTGSNVGSDPNSVVNAAMAQLHRLGTLASDPRNLGSIGELFQALNARLYFKFREARWGKRTVNRVAGGVVTFGGTPPPVQLYEGPTSRRHVKELKPPPGSGSGGAGETLEPCISDREGGSLGNVSRGERI
jgi:hypothetical protein